MNRTTSHYRLLVAVADADATTREQALQHLIGGLPTDLPVAGSGHTPGQVEIAYRATDDLQAISIAEGALREAGLTTNAAQIHTGYGAHRRQVAEQVAR